MCGGTFNFQTELSNGEHEAAYNMAFTNILK